MADLNRGKVPGTRSSYPGIIIVAAIVVLGLIIYWIAKQPSIAAHPNGPTTQSSKQVEFNDLAVTSKSGGFDIEGQAINHGDKPIAHLTVGVGFKNPNGGTLESQEAEVANADGTDLRTNPLPPDQARPILMKMTHAPMGWDQKVPQLQVKSVEWGEAQAQPAGGENPALPQGTSKGANSPPPQGTANQQNGPR